MKTILHVADINAPRRTVFGMLASINGLAGWWTTDVSGDPGPGGLIAFRFDGAGFDPDMRVVEFEEPDRIVWKCVGGVQQWADNTFHFDLIDNHADATRLRFRQNYATELSDDEYGVYNFNWGYFLESLRQCSETGSGTPHKNVSHRPAAYLIGQVIVGDEDGFAPYIEQTSTLITRYGGRVLDVVRAVEAVEGHWPIGALTALVRFPDETSLRAFWDSPENAAMKDLRHDTATSNVALCTSLAR
jgi:uncharacterized protein (DUF1330 family)/uncharacterized protein YndB with AHSA1/START domain